MAPPAHALRVRAAAVWDDYRQAVTGAPWAALEVRLRWERLVVRAALAELAAQGDGEAERRLRLEERED